MAPKTQSALVSEVFCDFRGHPAEKPRKWEGSRLVWWVNQTKNVSIHANYVICSCLLYSKPLTKRIFLQGTPWNWGKTFAFSHTPADFARNVYFQPLFCVVMTLRFAIMLANYKYCLFSYFAQNNRTLIPTSTYTFLAKSAGVTRILRKTVAN